MEKEVRMQKFKDKVGKDYPDFVQATQGLSAEDLRKKLLTYSKYREETSLAQSNDVKLQAAREQVKELNAPYKDALKALKAKIAFIYLLLKDFDDIEDYIKETNENE